MLRHSKSYGFMGCALLLASLAPAFAAGDIEHKPFVYPPAPRVDHVDIYHGVRVPDPYRWLEDLDSPQTRAWIAAENKVTFGILDDIPARPRIRRRLTELWDYERYEIPLKAGDRYFFRKNDGLQPQSVLYTVASLNEKPRVLLDPNKLVADGTVSLAGIAPSDDGRYLAYAISDGGSDWREWKVRDVDTGKDLEDDLRWVKFSDVSWSKDGRGFYYSRYAEPAPGTKMTGANYFQKVYFHRRGTDQSEDRLVYERKDHKTWGFDPHVTEDGRYLILHIWEGTEKRNRVYYKDLSVPGAKVVSLLDDFDASYQFVGNEGPLFWFFTDQGAPRGRLIGIDLTKPQRSGWKEIIAQRDETLRNVSLVGDRFIANYLKDASTQVRVHDIDGKFLREVKLPGIGSAGGFNGKRSDRETFFTFTSYTTPTTIYRYDAASGKSTVFRRPKVDFNPDDYETKQIFYHSKDGTRVPMFITSRKGLKRDGRNPTYLYGYGGFNIPSTPRFSVANMVWMEMGGVYAVACIRGGGEYGERWHQAGTKLHKQNVFDDFIAAAEWLIANKYTSTPKLAIGGRSNGGLLIGAVLNQRPDLFGAALPGVGVMDMLRFQKFTIGWAWVSDYGSSDEAEQFQALYAYSPYHNIKPGTVYPATLIVTADHDDRVVPLHSFKYAAALQAAQAGRAPTVIRIETRAGHGAGKSTKQRIDEITDQWSFLVRYLGMDALPGRAGPVAGGSR
ncbi:MAG: prolyl oligopeptidase family protein [Acidobacteriota bacterium]